MCAYLKKSDSILGKLRLSIKPNCSWYWLYYTELCNVCSDTVPLGNVYSYQHWCSSFEPDVVCSMFVIPL